MKKILSLFLVAVLLVPAVITRAETEKIPLDKCKVTISGEFYYTGNGITPTPKVTYKKKKLKKDRDYNLYYKDNVNVGTATITFVGMGDYTGSTTATFQIKKGKQTINAKNVKATFGDDPVNISAIANNPLSYKSSNTAVAEVSPVGTITIKGAGKAKITIKAEGSTNVAPAKKTITVTIAKAKPRISAFGGLVKKGDKWNLHAETTSDGKLTYQSSNKKIATVSKKGIVKTLKKGRVTITITSVATKNFKAATKKVAVEVN